LKSRPSNAKETADVDRHVREAAIRRAKRADLAQAADLIVRTKRLNNEFDPLFKVVDDAQSKAKEYLEESLGHEKVLLLVGVQGDKVVAILRAEVRERVLYEPSVEGFITDFYIMPEYRRKALGEKVLRQATKELVRMGAGVITAAVPTRNEIAVRFYTKSGFRSLVQLFAGKGQ